MIDPEKHNWKKELSCPACGSENIEQVSISKNGIFFKCKSCNYDFDEVFAKPRALEIMGEEYLDEIEDFISAYTKKYRKFPKIHVLKSENPYFTEMWNGTKRFDIRINDRSFELYDAMIQREYDKKTDTYSGRVIFCIITYILSNMDYCKDRMCVMSVDVSARADNSSFKIYRSKPAENGPMIHEYKVSQVISNVKEHDAWYSPSAVTAIWEINNRTSQTISQRIVSIIEDSSYFHVIIIDPNEDQSFIRCVMERFSHLKNATVGFKE